MNDKERQAAADFLYGVPAIAGYLGMREKQVRNRIEQKVIPTFKIKGTICSRRSTLDAWVAEQEGKALSQALEADGPSDD
ncbi:hypothetical protein AKG11_30975 [Shinella sp. SUS2]|uniref:hypothetical protein n=1 Tax=unclassified Shinella TaxID=2643062 RepID=UPI000682B525|nr:MULTISPECIES: hypothetical protein [unclassified Shinella]KNY13097.1 hypothetical protein AKG11_30975 [Shinella sp. SUS2]KOC71882.1 hypothetical protein AKG10_30395 [Shinella sp. GWS1]